MYIAATIRESVEIYRKTNLTLYTEVLNSGLVTPFLLLLQILDFLNLVHFQTVVLFIMSDKIKGSAFPKISSQHILFLDGLTVKQDLLKYLELYWM